MVDDFIVNIGKTYYLPTTCQQSKPEQQQQSKEVIIFALNEVFTSSHFYSSFYCGDTYVG